jgi:hypothetical protein
MDNLTPMRLFISTILNDCLSVVGHKLNLTLGVEKKPKRSIKGKVVKTSNFILSNIAKNYFLKIIFELPLVDYFIKNFS